MFMLSIQEVEREAYETIHIGLKLQSDNGSTLLNDTRWLTSPRKRRVGGDM
jgi:hypothetical protein